MLARRASASAKLARSAHSPGAPHARTPARRALLIGIGGLLWPLPPMLADAGFTVDVVTLPSAHFRHRVHVRRVARRADRRAALLAAAELDAAQPYDWIIVGDDETLLALRDHDGLSPEQKVRLAPVTAPEHLAHLGSKVELSRRLAAAGVPTPRFEVVADLPAALAAAEDIGWPIYLKADAGSASRGVRLCPDTSAARRAWDEFARAGLATKGGSADGTARVAGPAPLAPGGGSSPVASVVVQQALSGPTLDLSGIYVQGRLLHFTASQALGQVPGRGLITTKRYRPATSIDPDLVGHLRTLGHTLGLDGFANIGAVTDGAGDVLIIEADARPTVWAPYGAAVGDDPVARVRAWYHDSTVLLDEQFARSGPGTTPTVDITHFTRAARRDLLRNRQGLLEEFPWRSPDAWALFIKQFFDGGEARAWR